MPRRRAALHGRTGGARRRDDARRLAPGRSRCAIPTARSRSTCARFPGWAERYRNIPVLRGRHGSRRIARARLPRAHLVGEPAGPARRTGLGEGDGLVGRRSRRSCSARCSSSCPRSPGGRSGICSTARSRSSKASPGSAIFVVYLLAISRMRDIRRVFQYHGAEHKAIAAYENDVELTPETAQQFSTAHVRCGTNFLLTVMVVAILVYSVIPRPNLLVRHRFAHRADPADRRARATK